MPLHAANDLLRVAVLAGGCSPERDVSLRSGVSVQRALLAAGHGALMIDPAERDLDDIPWVNFDVAFIALHGGAGEDGRVQQQLDALDVPYTGSGPQASRLAMSKSASKDRFYAVGVPTEHYVLVDAAEPLEAAASRVAALGYPLVIKPDAQGSSLGVERANSPADLERCLRSSFQFDGAALAEPLIVGREFTVAVLDRRPLPLLEIVGFQGIFSYDQKYRAPTTEYRFHPALPHNTSGELEELAVRAAEALGTAGLVRVDLMLDHRGQPWVLEVNTSPGMTDRSLAPRAAAEAGLHMPALCDYLVRECLKLENSV